MSDDIISRAAAFAQAAHESIDQRRKYTDEPYIVHPAAVAKTVASVTDDQAMIAAAWLHDVVEDTPLTIDHIESEFGSDVAQLVSDLTDVAQHSDGNRATRKAMNRAHTALATPRAKTIKLADVLDNLSNLASHDPKFAKTFLGEKELLIEVLKEGNPELYQRVVELIAQVKQQLVEWETK